MLRVQNKSCVCALGAYCGGMNNATSQQIKVRACSIVCIDHPEWGTWGVMEDKGDHFEILGNSGSRVLHKCEADKFWRVVK